MSPVSTVELMIRGRRRKNPISQGDVSLSGWAVEARVYAEDPLRNFMPSIGRLVRYQAPEEDGHVRVDTGVFEGGEISMFYDPMIAKLIAGGEDRDTAVGRMRDALDRFYIRGIAHNIPFLAALMKHPRFAEGRLTTGFIEEEFPDGFELAHLLPDNPTLLVAVAGALHHVDAMRPHVNDDGSKEAREFVAFSKGTRAGSSPFAVRELEAVGLSMWTVPISRSTVAGRRAIRCSSARSTIRMSASRSGAMMSLNDPRGRTDGCSFGRSAYRGLSASHARKGST